MFNFEVTQEERSIIIAYRHLSQEERRIILKALELPEPAEIVHFPKRRTGAEREGPPDEAPRKGKTRIYSITDVYDPEP